MAIPIKFKRLLDEYFEDSTRVNKKICRRRQDSTQQEILTEEEEQEDDLFVQDLILIMEEEINEEEDDPQEYDYGEEPPEDDYESESHCGEELPDQECEFREESEEESLLSDGEELKVELLQANNPTTLQQERDISKDYLGIRNLGVGGFGIVKLCERIANGELVACKIISTEMYKPEEVDILRELSSVPGVIHIHDVYEDKEWVYLVMEYCPNGDLCDYMEQVSDVPSESEIAVRFKGLMETLSHCHEKGIVHRDIKPDNILLDESMSFVLADFGLATKISNGECLQGLRGTEHYVAPEMLDHGLYTEKVDVWSAGVLLCCLLTRQRPFQGDSCIDLYDAIKNQEINFSDLRWMNVSTHAIDLVSEMLTKDPHKRPSAEEVLKHPWFESFERKESSSFSNTINAMRGCGTGPYLMAEEQQRCCYVV